MASYEDDVLRLVSGLPRILAAMRPFVEGAAGVVERSGGLGSVEFPGVPEKLIRVSLGDCQELVRAVEEAGSV